MNEWFENDNFWERFAPIMFDEARWAGTAWETAGVIELSGIRSGGHILDSCCGVGRHSVEFSKRGFRVTAVDRTKSYITAAQETADAEKQDIEFILGDVRTFTRPDTYDLAVNLFTSFGFFKNLQDEEQYIKNIYKSLKPDGCFLIDVNGKEILSRDFVETEAWEKDGTLIYTEYRIEPGWDMLHNRWMIVDPSGERFDFSFTHRLYSAAELRRILMSCGFSKTDVYGGFDGKNYDNKADRLIVCAYK